MTLQACEDNLQLEPYKLKGDNTPLITLSSASTAVYTNMNYDEKEFTIEYDEKVVKKNSEGEKYATEEISIDLRNPNETYHLSIQVTGEKTDGIFSEYVIASIFTRAGYIVIPTVTIKENGDAIDCEKIGTINLLNRTFHQVYRNAENINVPFQYIYYKPQMGIVGFHDENGILWVLQDYK